MADATGNQTEIKLVITADGSVAVASMKQVGDATRKMESETGLSFSALKGHWFALTAAVASVSGLVYKAHQYMIEGAKAMQAEEAYRIAADNLKINANRMIEDLKRVTNRTIDESDLMQKAMKAMTNGMDEEKIVRIGEIARMSARRMGVDVGQAYNDIMDAVEIMKTRTLKAYGLINADQMKIIDSAKEAGAQVDIFRIISLNAAIQAETMGKLQENAAEQVQRHAAAWKELTEETGKWIISIKGWIAEDGLKQLAFFRDLGDAIKAIWQGKGQERAEQVLNRIAMDQSYMPGPNYGEPAGDKDAARKKLDDYLAHLKTVGSKEGQNIASIWAAIEERYRASYVKAVMEGWKAEEAHLLTTADAIQKELETRLAYEDKIDQFRQRAKVITDDGAIRNRYAREQLSLEGKLAEIDAKRQKLNENEYGNAEKLRELGLKELEIRNQLVRLKTYEVMDLDEKRRANEEEQLKKLQEIVKQQREASRADYEARWSGMMDMANQVGGEAGMGLGKTAASMKGIADVAAGYDPWTEKTRRAQEHYNAIREMELQGLASEYETQAAYDQLNLQREQAYQQQRLSIAGNTMGAMAGMAQAFYALSGQQSGAAFNAFKAFKIAETMINTYSAAMGAYNAMASIPYIGPFLGIAAAAAALAFGAAQVSAIASMKPGGGAATAASPSASGGYSYTQPTTPAWEEQKKADAAPSIVINYHHYGTVVSEKELARNLVPLIEEAKSYGAH